jgi:hypothetical protein
MRFACQSCGKAYNLPEERIAEKSNVKLKCRVCGAIVEVKKQGEVVARILDDGKNEPGRVSEAPTPLTSMMPDDADDATAAIAFSDHILSERGPGDIDIRESALGDAVAREAVARGWSGQTVGSAHRGLPPVPQIPPAAATGFGATPMPPPLSQHGSAAFARPEAAFAPMAQPDSPPALSPPPLAPPANSGGAPPLPMPGSSGNASPSPVSGLHALDAGVLNGAQPVDTGLPSPMGAAGFGSAGLGNAAFGNAALAGGTVTSFPAAPVPSTSPQRDDTNMKMLAALVTGILIGFIIARLFF